MLPTRTTMSLLPEGRELVGPGGEGCPHKVLEGEREAWGESAATVGGEDPWRAGAEGSCFGVNP